MFLCGRKHVFQSWKNSGNQLNELLWAGDMWGIIHGTHTSAEAARCQHEVRLKLVYHQSVLFLCLIASHTVSRWFYFCEWKPHGIIQRDNSSLLSNMEHVLSMFNIQIQLYCISVDTEGHTDWIHVIISIIRHHTYDNYLIVRIHLLHFTQKCYNAKGSHILCKVSFQVLFLKICILLRAVTLSKSLYVNICLDVQYIPPQAVKRNRI